MTPGADTSSARCFAAQAACSAKCRAALSRRRRETARAHRDQAIRALLEPALKRLEDAGR
jgi:hypothetical protein